MELFTALISKASQVVLMVNSILAATSTSYLTAIAVVTDSHNNSAFECWQLTKPFSASKDAGIVGVHSLNLGDFHNVTYTVVPGHYHGGLHPAPRAQLIHFASGEINITLPTTNDTWASVSGGPSSFLIAVDTTGDGHISDFPSGDTTAAWQLSFPDGIIPPHKVVSDSKCNGASSIIQR